MAKWFFCELVRSIIAPLSPPPPFSVPRSQTPRRVAPRLSLRLTPAEARRTFKAVFGAPSLVPPTIAPAPGSGVQSEKRLLDDDETDDTLLKGDAGPTPSLAGVSDMASFTPPSAKKTKM